MFRTQYPKNAGSTVDGRVLVAYSHDRVADGELWLDAPVQPHQRVSCCTFLAQENIKIQSTVSIECASLLHHRKVESSWVRDQLFKLWICANFSLALITFALQKVNMFWILQVKLAPDNIVKEWSLSWHFLFPKTSCHCPLSAIPISSCVPGTSYWFYAPVSLASHLSVCLHHNLPLHAAAVLMRFLAA